jgi:hypothetical protein
VSADDPTYGDLDGPVSTADDAEMLEGTIGVVACSTNGDGTPLLSQEEHDAIATDAEALEGTIGLDLPDGVMPDGTAARGCLHPAESRRLVDGDQVCTEPDCWEVIDTPQAIVPRDRPGSEDPTIRTTDGARPVGLRHVKYDPDQQYGSRPYTPEEVELEITRILSQIERGAGFWTSAEEQRSAAKVRYEIDHARALINSTARSAESREAEAMLACREQYERWQLLELTCRTAREGMHNLRSELNGFQSVLRSANTLLGNYR